MVIGNVTTRRFASGIVATILVAGAVTASVALLDGAGTRASIGENASERYAAVDGMTATVTTVVERGDERNRTVHRLAMRPGSGQVSLETVSGSSTGPEVVVANGSVRWAYDRDDGLIRRTDASGLQSTLRDRGERIERLFRQVDTTGATTVDGPPATPGVSPLPAIPVRETTPSPTVTNRSATGYEVVYRGTDTVAGRSTHVLSLSPTAETDTRYADLTQTIWIDATHYVPLKYRTNWTADGERVQRTVTLSNVSFDPGLSADRFQFEPPTGAAVVTPDLGVTAAERIEAIDGLAATVHTRVTGLDLNATDGRPTRTNDSRTDDRYETVSRLQIRPGTGKRRVEMRRSEQSGPDLVVSNGTTTWLYDESENNVTRTDAVRSSGGTFSRQGERIERLFARLERTRTAAPANGSTTDPGLISVPGAGMTAPGSRLSVSPTGSYGVTLVGADTVDGRTAYVLRLTATDDGNATFGNYTRTMWIDSELFVPLKHRTTFTTPDGNRVTSVVTYTNVTVDPEFAPGTFTFEPPENATISTTRFGGSKRYDSRDALAANSSLAVPTPTVPSDFTLDGARGVEAGNITSISLVYVNETSRLAVTKSIIEGRELSNLTANRTRGRTIRIGDRNGTYTRMGPYAAVAWSCGETRYSVGGSAVSRPLLIQVAESVGCE